MNNSTKLFFVLAAGWLTTTVSAQDRIHYTGTELSNPAYHDGQLSLAAISASFIVFIVKQFIGKEKGADGSVSTGLLAMASKINELINDHVKRKKDAAEIEQIK